MTEEKTKEALRALERILSYTNGLGDGEAYTIRAALTAPDVNADIPEWLKTLDYQRDLALIWIVAKGSKDYDETIGDRIERVQQLILEQKKALTETSLNAELLEALKEVRDVIRTEGVLNNMKYDALGAKVYQAIARAEQKGQNNE